MIRPAEKMRTGPRTCWCLPSSGCPGLLHTGEHGLEEGGGDDQQSRDQGLVAMADLKGMGGEETGDTIIFTKDCNIITHV